MALKQEKNIDQIEITRSNVVQIRTSNQVIDDSFSPPKIIAGELERRMILPGDDYSQEDQRIQDVCKAVHTPETIAAFQAEQKANKPKVEA